MEMVSASLIILGSGCAGLTAAIYASRAGLDPIVIDGAQPGGQLTLTSKVENFPGFPDGIDGFELVQAMRNQAQKFGARFEGDSVESLELDGDEKVLRGQSGTYRCRALILATGAQPRMLEVEGEREYYGGKGVSTCATCDGAFFRNKTVAVIGGGDSAVEEALFLTHFCSKVYLVHRRDQLRASKVMADRALSNGKIQPIWNSSVRRIVGDGNRVTGLVLEHGVTGELSDLPCDGVFLAIGHRPNSAMAFPVLAVDGEGYFISNPASPVETRVPGIFVAGDCTDRQYRQAVVAAGLGAQAAMAAERWLEEVGRPIRRQPEQESPDGGRS